MSQHRSLRVSSKSKKHRSVFKRLERIRILMKQDKWPDEEASAYNLPKIKSVKIKMKKEKAAEAPGAAAPGAAPAGATAAAGAGAVAKPQAAAGKKPAEDTKAQAKGKK